MKRKNITIPDSQKYWFDMPFGRARRLALMKRLYEDDTLLYVNKKYQAQTKYDSDIKYLLNKGYLSYGGTDHSYGMPCCTNRFLVLNREKYEKNILKRG